MAIRFFVALPFLAFFGLFVAFFGLFWPIFGLVWPFLASFFCQAMEFDVGGARTSVFCRARCALDDNVSSVFFFCHVCFVIYLCFVFVGAAALYDLSAG